MRMFAAMALFLVLVMLGGYLLAVALFVPAFLLFVARVTPRTTIIYTLVLCALLADPALDPAGRPADRPPAKLNPKLTERAKP